MTIKLIAGLGNFETSYFNTRHNFGSRYVQSLANRYKVILSKNTTLCGYIGQLKLETNIVNLLIPDSYMNNNGFSVSKCVDFYQLCPQEILVAHDDLNLPPGVMRIKLGKNINNSHRGLQDVIVKLHNKYDFYRLRIGIGHPGDKSEVIDFVLNKPTVYEKRRINYVINEAILHTEDIVNKKFVKVMNQLHTYKSNVLRKY
ncbi:aminoacyl-tRNA hydrolase [Blochmannia endosymbiont of Camponotus sp. C-003]|uniref:aminoacyl-tRNA hydrolase n=1 Tax=unclassified Candidatus Blochmanniella TaxID=711328 RepID=UPI0020257024|nr:MULTISPECIES: aminoacyl-tRNA hydrolase [unclassified Candidatus Blochmannia]URJ23468.1 aminoacyl-tRNA hydrolase [Blochmannia endosymbiont of Camponotus sp. C-003]URJ28940.1 aminoacyl-tRNA hydrolase [Blochmannia endosymbiont of Camponotus sp. C-046]